MKKVLYSSTLIAALLLGACGNDDKVEESKKITDQATKSEDQVATPKENEKVEAEIAKKNEGVVEEKADFKYDEKVKTAIEKEKDVSSTSLLITKVNDEDYIMTDINVLSTNKGKAKKLAEKYAKVLHNKYPKNVVDVRILSGDQVLAQKILK